MKYVIKFNRSCSTSLYSSKPDKRGDRVYLYGYVSVCDKLEIVDDDSPEQALQFIEEKYPNKTEDHVTHVYQYETTIKDIHRV